MSYIKVRIAPREVLKVWVLDGRCPQRPCFWWREHYVSSPGAGASGCSSRASGMYICGTNDQRGCPSTLPDPDPKRAEYRRAGSVWFRVERP